MIATQRLLMIIILVNLTIGIVAHTYYSPDDVYYGMFDTQQSQLDAYEEKFNNDDTWWGGIIASGIEVVQTIGNGVKIGFMIISILLKAINPFGLNYLHYSGLERLGVLIITLFRSILVFILGLEAYLLFINKKTS